MNSPEDSGLRARFANLRQEDRKATPSFGRIAAQGTVSSRRGFSQRIALAAMLVVALAVVFTWRSRRSSDADPRELAAWSSPTAFLLETPGKQLLIQVPRLGEPLISTLPAAQDGPK